MDVALENAPRGLPKVQRAHSAEMQRQSLRQKDRVNKLDRAPARAEQGRPYRTGRFFTWRHPRLSGPYRRGMAFLFAATQKGVCKL